MPIVLERDKKKACFNDLQQLRFGALYLVSLV